MTYDEMTAWLNRYRNARRIEPRLKEQLREEERRAAYADILRKAGPGGGDDLDAVLVSINTRRQKLTAQLMNGEAVKVEIEGAISDLDDALEREVLQLRYLGGKTNRQIADRMRVTERYVRKLHRRAVLKLSRVFQN